MFLLMAWQRWCIAYAPRRAQLGAPLTGFFPLVETFANKLQIGFKPVQKFVKFSLVNIDIMGKGFDQMMGKSNLRSF
jgi:hypothetical protein